MVSALNDTGREVKAHIIQRAPIKSTFTTNAGQASIGRGSSFPLGIFYRLSSQNLVEDPTEG